MIELIVSGISCVQFDDTRIVSGSWDKTIKVAIQPSVLCIDIIYGMYVHVYLQL